MEFPDLQHAIHDQYPTDQVRLVGVHLANEPPGLVQDFREQTGVTFPLLADEGDTIFQIALPRGTGMPYPRDVVVDENLVIRSNKNSFDPVEMQQLIDELLAEED